MRHSVLTGSVLTRSLLRDSVLRGSGQTGTVWIGTVLTGSALRGSVESLPVHMAPGRQIPWSWRLKKATKEKEIMTPYKDEDVARPSVLELLRIVLFYPLPDLLRL